MLTEGAHRALFVRADRDHAAFGATADGARHMGNCRTAAATGQDEFLQTREVRVVIGKRLVERKYPFRRQQGEARDAELAAEVKQIVLNMIQKQIDCGRQGFAAQESECRVEFIDIPHRGDARRVFCDPAAIAKSGGAIVTGSSGNGAEPKPHDVLGALGD